MITDWSDKCSRKNFFRSVVLSLIRMVHYRAPWVKRAVGRLLDEFKVGIEGGA